MLSAHAVNAPEKPGKARKTGENRPGPDRLSVYHAMLRNVSASDMLPPGGIPRIRGGGIFMGEEYHRMTPLPNFLLKTHGSHRGDRQNAPTLSVRPVKAHFVPW